jgi:hypothetical protein
MSYKKVRMWCPTCKKRGITKLPRRGLLVICDVCGVLEKRYLIFAFNKSIKNIITK